MKRVLLFGLGPVGIEYTNILLSMGYSVVPVGRSLQGRQRFQEITGIKALCWGSIVLENMDLPEIAIVAVGEAQLYDVVEKLIIAGITRVLVEKPGASSYAGVEKLAELAENYKCDVRVAYNRRFYSSVIHGQEIILRDGGVRSFHFDFSEWSHKIEPLVKEDGVKQRWFFHNSSHVVDMAFYLGGWPKEIFSLEADPLNWHPSGQFVGMGKTINGALFSYNADWVGPGRWGMEIVTAKHRLVYRPLEKLQVQELGTIGFKDVAIDDSLDISYKPGFYKQVENFLSRNSSILSIQDQLSHLAVYRKMCADQ
jgi:predicted dehydrogenase